MVMRSYCLDFLARRGETPHQENISLSSTTWTLKQGQEKQTDPSYQNKSWGLLGYTLEPQLANLETNARGVLSPSNTPPIQFLHPRQQDHEIQQDSGRDIRGWHGILRAHVEENNWSNEPWCFLHTECASLYVGLYLFQLLWVLYPYPGPRTVETGLLGFPTSQASWENMVPKFRKRPCLKQINGE